jgi:Cd2+/Zn2+-exporting ATPase
VIPKVEKLIRGLEPGIVMRGEGAPAGERSGGLPFQSSLRYGAMALGALLFAGGLAFSWGPFVRLAFFISAYLLVGGEVLFRALGNIAKGRIFDENFLMAAASLGAFAIGEYPEGVAVMLFYQVGETFQDLAVNRSRASISALMDIRPDFANLKTPEGLVRVRPEDVKPGDLIVVKPGEKIALDGVVAGGSSALDTSALTGESLPRDVEEGSEVLSGSINRNGLLTVRVSKSFADSTVSRILDLVQNAGSRKAPAENFITKFARYYTPVVVFAALSLALLPSLLIPGAEFSEWIHRALFFLVVSCPCALVISVPLSFFGGIGGASRRGILIKGGNFLEALNQAEIVVFDKTGTLTRGVFMVSGIFPSGNFSAEELLYYAAAAESGSNHPIALSIRRSFQRNPGAGGTAKNTVDPTALKAEEIPGKGIRAFFEGKTLLAGSGKLLEDAGIDYGEAGAEPEPGSGTAVYVAVDGVYAGRLAISDELKADSRAAVRALKAAGIKRVLMLTGDNRGVSEKIAADLGLDGFYAELLPQEKVEQLERLEKEKSPRGKLVFVGDGINDAPVLARSDIGIAMGGAGSDAAIEAADIVLMTDEPSKLLGALETARKTHRIVWQNIIFALGVKGAILILGALGIASMWAAVFGDVGVALIAILNAMRALSGGKKTKVPVI